MSSPNPIRNPRSLRPRHTSRGAIAGLVLASGRSTRFEAGNKLLAEIRGVPIVRRSVEAYVDAQLDPVLVVVGYEAEQVAEALAGLTVVLVENSEFQLGQSRGLRRGVAALPEEVGAAVIGVGDQPMVTAGIIQDLVREYGRSGACIVAPRYGGRRGNPVLFDSALFPELLSVDGDQGGRGVIQHHAEEVMWLDVADVRAGQDVDTRLDYQRLTAEDKS